MKIEYDLIRRILLKVEADTDGDINYTIADYCEQNFPDVDLKKSTYHFNYLVKAGMIEATNSYFSDLTHSGHDFANNIHSDTIWNRTKEKIKPLGEVGIKVIASVAAELVKEFLKIPH